MQKVTRSVDKPAQSGSQKRAANPSKSAPGPTLSRVTGDIDLAPPRGFCASVLLKQVSRDDGHRYYSWWAMAGRHDADVFSVKYKYHGEDLIRCDLPEGMALSEDSLQPHLASFLAGEHNQPDGTPIIRD